MPSKQRHGDRNEFGVNKNSEPKNACIDSEAKTSGGDTHGLGFHRLRIEKQPDWQRLEGLQPHAFLKGYRHKNGTLWLLDAGMGEEPPDHEAFTSNWPCQYAPPDELVLPPGYAEFVNKAGSVAKITMTYSPRVLSYGAAVAALAGVRTYLWGANDEDFDLAFVLHNGQVEAFGAEGGLMEILWDNGNICIHPMFDPEEPDEVTDEATLTTLEALPFVRVQRDPKAFDGELYRWPVRMWPRLWGNPSDILGLGTWDYSTVWRNSLVECYYRPGHAEAESARNRKRGLFGRLFRRTDGRD